MTGDPPMPPQSATFTCPYCGAVSHNPTDVRESYCGRCHTFDEARAAVDRAVAAQRAIDADLAQRTVTRYAVIEPDSEAWQELQEALRSRTTLYIAAEGSQTNTPEALRCRVKSGSTAGMWTTNLDGVAR